MEWVQVTELVIVRGNMAIQEFADGFNVYCNGEILIEDMPTLEIAKRYVEECLTAPRKAPKKPSRSRRG